LREILCRDLCDETRASAAGFAGAAWVVLRRWDLSFAHVLTGTLSPDTHWFVSKPEVAEARGVRRFLIIHLGAALRRVVF